MRRGVVAVSERKKKIERKERREERERAVTGSNVTERVQGGEKTTKYQNC